MKLSCIHCDFAYTVTAAQLGMKGKCPKCGGGVRIPQGAQSTEPKRDDRKHRSLFRRSLSACVSMVFHLMLILLLMMVTWRTETPVIISEEVGMGLMPTGDLSDSSGLTFAESGSANAAETLEVEAILIQAPTVEFGDVASLQRLSEMAPSASTPGGGGNTQGLMSGGGASGSGGGGGGGDASFMGVGAKGKRFCIIADFSGSMEGQKFEYTKREIETMVRGLKRGTEFHVILFSDDATPCPGNPWFPARVAPKLSAIDWVKRAELGYETNPEPAFRSAFRLDPKPDVIWLMTDGIFEADVVDKIRNMNTGPKITQIHTIGLLDKKAEGLLRKIAADSGGTYTYVGRAR